MNTQNNLVAIEVDNVDEGPCFFIVDKLALRGSRTHELRNENDHDDVRNFTFSGKTKTKVPVCFAMDLLKISTFEVFNEDGRLLKEKTKGEGAGGGSIVLEFDETIAKLEELTNASLIKRAEKFGGTFKKNAAKVVIISFLIEAAGNKVAKKNVPTPASIDDTFSDLSEEEELLLDDDIDGSEILDTSLDDL